MNTLKVKLLFVTMVTVSSCFAQWSGNTIEVLTSGSALIDLGTVGIPTVGAEATYELNDYRTKGTLLGRLTFGEGYGSDEVGGSKHRVTGVHGFVSLDEILIDNAFSSSSADGGLFEMEYNDAFIADGLISQTLYVSGVKGVLEGSGNGSVPGAVSAVIGLDKIKGTHTLAGYFDGNVKIVNGTLDVEYPPVFPNLELSSGALQLSGFNQQWTSSDWNVGITSPLNTAWVSTNSSNGDYMGIGMTGSGWYFIKSADAPGATSSNACIPFQVTLAGKTITREVEVTLTGWCDYVFDEDYSLRPLEEVEAFIAEHHHLPEVPSEAEVLEKGVNLGEMDAVLLKKIEELTLYVLQQQKEIDALKAKVN